MNIKEAFNDKVATVLRQDQICKGIIDAGVFFDVSESRALSLVWSGISIDIGTPYPDTHIVLFAPGVRFDVYLPKAFYDMHIQEVVYEVRNTLCKRFLNGEMLFVKIANKIRKLEEK